MRILYNKLVEAHNIASDNEGPYRVRNFVENTPADLILGQFPAITEAVREIHSQRHLQKMRGASRTKSLVAETFLIPESYQAMLASVVLATMAAKENAFAVTRPPGHHASKNKAMGFCFFNNMAIAASPLLKSGGKICIVDIDGHHGNGTENLFRDEERVLYCSIHQDSVFPGTGQADDIGSGPSYKHVINIPLRKGSGDDLFLGAIRFFQPYIERFAPDQIAVSAGFDGYVHDRLLALRYTKKGFHDAGRLLASFGKPVFAVLEGGYHQEIFECVEAFTSGISCVNTSFEEGNTESSIDCADACNRVLDKLTSLLK